ncbi:MAG: EAL domain-containing protein [Burkholderiaceae bacterium]
MKNFAATILIVDDEAKNRKLLEALLRPEGYLTEVAANGSEALIRIAEHPPDLILLDIMMPIMDGYQLASRLKADPATSSIPIIMVTAQADRDARLAALNAGAEEFLTKPVDRAELWLRVRNLLRLKAFGDLLKDYSSTLEEEVEIRAADLQRFRTAMDATADAILLLSRASMRFVEANATACTMLGYSREELFQICPTQLGEMTMSELEGMYDGIIAGVSTNALAELRLRRKNGSRVQVELQRQAHRFGTDWIIVSVVRDVTDRKAAEQKIKRLNRVYAFLSGVNALIVRVRDRNELFGEACRIAVELGQLKMAWVGIVDYAAMMIEPVASALVDPEFLAVVRATFSLDENAPSGKKMAARAVREKRVFVANDIANDPGVLFAKERVERGILSMAILPLLVSNKPVAVLALYADEIGFFDEEEVKLLTGLAGNIGFALDHIGKEEKINYLAYYDDITGLPNRTLFLERVSQCLRPRDGAKSTVALALVDIDRFRAINDALGRQAGDDILKLVAQRIRASEARFETIAQVGADCFGVVILDPRDAGTVALDVEQLLRACFSEPFALQESVLRIAGKAGIAVFPLDGETAETLLRNAEAALKRAKRSVEPLLFYSPEMNTRVAAALDMESKLRTALDLDQFVLHYQPKITIETGALSGVEALIRWNDPQLGLVAPGRFIPILEETGLIYDVGRWALRQAIADYLRWRSGGFPAVRIAVNVSPVQLRDRDFVAEIANAIAIDPLAAAGLELELTESLIMEDVATSIASLEAIRAMGVHIAVDDFGTGYSSLSYLSKLPVNTLKIDRAFVIDMTEGKGGLTLVSTIVNLAHSLKLKVVAEGVETEEQSRLLLSLDCDELQGYLFSKPVPRDIFEARFLGPLVQTAPARQQRSSKETLAD